MFTRSLCVYLMMYVIEKSEEFHNICKTLQIVDEL